MRKIKVQKSLKTEFLGMFIISLTISFAFGLMLFYSSEKIYNNFREEKYLAEREDAKLYLEDITKEAEKSNENFSLNSLKSQIENRTNINNRDNISIVDDNGKIVYKSGNENLNYRDYIFYKPVIISGEKYIIFIEGQYKANKLGIELITMLIIIIAVILFVLIFFKLANRRINYIKEISDKVDNIAKGNLSTFIEIEGNDELTSLAGNINYMAYSLKERNEYEEKIEKSKRDLITNMSHDLRSPLTSIIGYLNLIKEKKYDGEETLEEYADISFKKSIQLKELIERLFEYTKITNDKIIIEKQKININLMLNQIIEEYAYIIKFNKLKLKKDIKNEKLNIVADPLLLVRLFENLIMNAIKYSKKPGYLSVESNSDNKFAYIKFRNEVEEKFEKEELDKIFERTYIRDKSRKEGSSSGLGLAISKEIVEMNGGKIWAEIEENEIVFNLKFRKV